MNAIEERSSDLRRRTSIESGGRCMRRPRGRFSPCFIPQSTQRTRRGNASANSARSAGGRNEGPVYGGNGNMMGYVDDSGTFVAKFEYDSYGDIISIEGDLPLPLKDGPPVDISGLHGSDFSFGFSTKYHDREVGLVAYQLRSYSPVLGRWLNRDPIEEKGGVNLYGFVDNMPSGLFDLSGMHSFKFVDLGWSYANILSGNIVDMLGTPITDHIGVTPYFLIAESRCLCESGKYVPDYTFKLLVYSLIQDSNDPVWTNNAYSTKIDDPRVKNKWNSFWFFTVRRRINLVLEHEERHRKHARESYDDIIAALKVKEEFLTREECEKWAKGKIKSAKWLYEMIEKEKAANVEKGRR